MAEQATSTSDVPGEVLEAAAPEPDRHDVPDQHEVDADGGPDDMASSPEAARGVTFRIPAGDARSAALVGDFNGWSTDATPMELNGDWYEATIELAPGAYRYRYLLDGERWENDWNADDYAPNQFGGDDSVRRV
jgi:1,4-alpha-glucan branching enzyme